MLGRFDASRIAHCRVSKVQPRGAARRFAGAVVEASGGLTAPQGSRFGVGSAEIEAAFRRDPG